MSTPTEKVLAHVLVPEPADDASNLERTRYHLARAIGLLLGWMGNTDDVMSDDRNVRFRYMARLSQVVAEQHLALLTYAVHTAQADPIRWASDRANEEGGEWLWEAARAVDLDPDAVAPYPVHPPTGDTP